MIGLKKTLGPLGGAALMLNIVIGAGLLSLPGLAYEVSGPNALWVWGLCAIVSMPLLAVFIIMGSRYPNAGGIAHFCQMAFGRYAYIASSFLFLGAVVFGLPAIGLVGGHYLSDLTDIDPALGAIAILILATSVQFTAPEKASRISGYIATAILVALVLIIIVGVSGLDHSWVSARPIEPPTLELSTLMLPFMMIFFAFTGWEVAAGTTEEFKNPRRDFPIAMALSFVIAVGLYLGMATIIHFTPISGSYEAAFSEVMRLHLGEWGGIFMSTLAVVIIFANLMGAIWAVSRMLVSLSREEVIPLELNTDASGRPVKAACYLVISLVCVLFLDLFGLLAIKDMLEIAGQNFIFLYALAAACLLKMSSMTLHKFFGIIAVALVIGLLSHQGVTLSYPLGLLAAAALIFCINRSNPALSDGKPTMN